MASRDIDRAKVWGQKEHLETCYGSYDELLVNSQIDVVYIATTTNAHYKNILQCLHAGKHVLCEKSLVCTYEQAKEVCTLAKEKNLFLMEAMWSRFLLFTEENSYNEYHSAFFHIPGIKLTLGTVT